MKLLSLLAASMLLYSGFVNAQVNIRPVQVERERGDRDRGRDDRNGGNYDNAQSGSAITVFSESGDMFFLLINGVKQNYNPQGKVRVEGLPQMINDVQIVFADNSTRAIMKRIAFTDPVDGRPINLVLKIVRERDGDARLRFFRSAPLENDYQPDPNEYRMYYGRDNMQQQQGGQVVIDRTPPPPPVPQGPQPMDDNSFAAAKSTIAGNNFDDGKLSTAKSIGSGNYFTTDQVIAICQLFQWDETKLDFAKFAYNRTVDNNNYFKVNNVFQWDSNKDLLNTYVNQNRK